MLFYDSEAIKEVLIYDCYHIFFRKVQLYLKPIKKK